MDIFYPIEFLANWLTYTVFGLQVKTVLADAVNFFIFDTIKIFILLSVIIFIVSIIRSYLPPERIRNLLSRKNKYFGNVLASLLGIITPFCSCSAVPLFIGFVDAGVPLGITFSFLIASPMINEVALVLLLGMFGWKVALIYIFSGLIIAIFSGIVIGKLKVEYLVEKFVFNNIIQTSENEIKMQWQERVEYARDYTADIYNGPQKLDNMLSYRKRRKMEVQGYYEDEICVGI
ncbi:MAG: permease [Nitrospirae bacterium]|nr:permease [Nitrospirota bacterium]